MRFGFYGTWMVEIKVFGYSNTCTWILLLCNQYKNREQTAEKREKERKLGFVCISAKISTQTNSSAHFRFYAICAGAVSIRSGASIELVSVLLHLKAVSANKMNHHCLPDTVYMHFLHKTLDSFPELQNEWNPDCEHTVMNCKVDTGISTKTRMHNKHIFSKVYKCVRCFFSLSWDETYLQNQLRILNVFRAYTRIYIYFFFFALVQSIYFRLPNLDVVDDSFRKQLRVGKWITDNILNKRKIDFQHISRNLFFSLFFNQDDFKKINQHKRLLTNESYFAGYVHIFVLLSLHFIPQKKNQSSFLFRLFICTNEVNVYSYGAAVYEDRVVSRIFIVLKFEYQPKYIRFEQKIWLFRTFRTLRMACVPSIKVEDLFNSRA